MFTDLAGSTELRVELGEERADELRRVHHRLLSSVVQDHDGAVVKGTGDGLMAVFRSASGAVAASVAMQRAVADYNTGDDALAALQVRIGVSAGDVAIEDGDYFGTPVIEAARLCNDARPGEILVAELVRVLTRNRGGHRFGPAEPRSLKGLPEPVAACMVHWRPGDDAESGERARRVRILGPFEVEGVDPAAFGSRKARQLVRLLAVRRGRAVPVDQIVDALWPEQPPAKPSDQVSVLASRVRSVLGAGAVVRSDAGYALQVQWLDLDEFDALAAEAEQRLAAGSIAAARAAAEAALQLARGPLLADEPDAAWVDDERFAFARKRRDVLLVAGEAELDGGDAVTAAEMAEQALEHDPYDETALRLLLRAQQRAGRVASALAAYARFRARLRDELGISPTNETEALHTALLAAGDERDRRNGALEVATGEHAAAAAPREAPLLDHAPLAGRAGSLAALDAELERALPGATRLVVVEGESGIGKSTLLDRWMSAVEAAGVPVLVGRCDELSRQLPLQAVLDAVDGYLRRLEPAAIDALLSADSDVLSPLLGGSPRRRPPVEPVYAPDHAVTLAGGGDDQTRFFAALCRLVDTVAANAGAVLVLDDLHFAGESTGEWLRFFHRRSRGHVLVVVATRTEGKPVLHPDTTLTLEPFGLDAIVELIGDEDRARTLLERSGGHPLLLVELAHADDDELPASIRDAATARLRQMGEAGATVQSAAVLGPDIDLDLLADVLRRPTVEVLDDLEQGVAHRFLDESGATLVFRHALVREALAAGLSAARRSLLHREAARVLHQRGDADPLDVAHHARAAGQTELAAAMLADAAARAMRRYDRAEAVRLLDEAIKLHDTPDYRLQRGLEQLALGEYTLAAADADAARRAGAGARADELLGWALYYQRDFERSRAVADEGARTAGDDAALAASCLVLAGRVLQAAGELPEADERMSQAEALVDAARLPVVPIWIASLRVNQGRHAEGLELVERGLRQPGAIQHPFAVIHAHIARAHGLAQLGHVDEALATLDAMDREVAERDVAERFGARADNWRGWIVRYLGAFEEADERNVAAAETAWALGMVEPVAHSLLDRADGALLQGQPDRALVLLEEAGPYDEDEHAMRWRHVIRRQLLFARLALATGDWDRAEERAAAVAADGRARGAERYATLGSLVEAMARAGRGDNVDRAGVGRLINRLAKVAGGEAWWWEAQAAAQLGVDEWRARAGRSVATLAARAGDRLPALERFADRVLG